jgi:hypothetical protein
MENLMINEWSVTDYKMMKGWLNIFENEISGLIIDGLIVYKKIKMGNMNLEQ